KFVLEKAYLEFKKSIPKENKEKEEEKLLQVFEKFFADDRIIYEFQSAFEGKGDEVDVDILAEIFV
ncbi:MAG: hypothetical protein GTO45_18830, partial [Candidatus Aminicenantes bacterium]|nr:hypothetical protein [Candidatus Aminicenantes bacterium]NIM80844.1 hypothetical protein [Candidatus Aminicenantes bacterium]NIN20228.1 hypothetical protein [Candidatus Aminicenantes bacterium]NIN44007.1 hypothetical protein [Candidatus Aminicenantes bacterium]NIN86816.1 hypothetical protein [Candidatus Aminicenantes bacterium]